MTKIVLDTAALKALFGLHPEVEVELLAVAREKVAEELKRKLPPNHAETVVKKMVSDIERAVNDKVLGYRSTLLSDTTKTLLTKYVEETCLAQAKKLAEDTAKTAVEKAVEAAKARLEDRMTQHQDALIKKINGFVGEEISRQISARLDAMAKLTVGLGG